jgi:HAD superfamily hydrolase (TIGR01509 family)
VLIDSADAHWESWRRLADENGVSVSHEQFISTFGRPSNDIIPLFFGEVSSTKMRARSDRKEAIYRDFIGDHPPIVAGAVDLIRSLHAAGVALALGSSGPRDNIDLVLGAMRVTEAMSVIVSADNVTRGKPDPQVFQLAAQRLGLTPDRCIVIEDAPAGVQAAKAAGTRVVAVLIYHPRRSFAQADFSVDRLTDLSVQRLHALMGV